MNTEILKILENDARATPERISTMTDIPVDEVSKEIKQAEKDRVILKYKTVINWDKISNDQVSALIEVKVAPQRDVGFESIAERIYKFPQARTVYLLSGSYDLLVQVTGKTMREVAEFVSHKLAPIEGVQSTVSHFMLRRYKEDGEIIEAKEEGKRQAVFLAGEIRPGHDDGYQNNGADRQHQLHDADEPAIAFAYADNARRAGDAFAEGSACRHGH